MTSVPTNLYTRGRLSGMTTQTTTSTLRRTTFTHNSSVLISLTSSKMWIKLERQLLMSSFPTSGYPPQRGIRSLQHGTIWCVSRHAFVAFSCLVAVPALTVMLGCRSCFNGVAADCAPQMCGDLAASVVRYSRIYVCPLRSQQLAMIQTV